MLADWNQLPDNTQLQIARQAICSAAETIASQAEALAKEIDAGLLGDRGGAEALRLLSALMRAGERSSSDIRDMAVAGRA